MKMNCSRCLIKLKLLILIEKKRKEMIDLSAIHGMNSKVTIQTSQELDKLMNKLFLMFYHKKSA